MIDGATKDKFNIKMKPLPDGATAKDLDDVKQSGLCPILENVLDVKIDTNDIKPDGSVDVDILHVPHSKNNDEPDRYGQHKEQYSDKESGYYIKPEVIAKKQKSEKEVQNEIEV